MKRIIVLFLCAVTVLACFAACGKTEPAQETETETTADVTEPEETKDPNYEADLPEVHADPLHSLIWA